MLSYHNITLVHNLFWLVRTCLVWRAFLYILVGDATFHTDQFTMLQVADDLVLVIKLVAQHPEVQLASIALPGFPADVKDYVSGVEMVVSGVQFTADAWDLAIRYVCSPGCELYLPIRGDMPSTAVVMHPYVACQAHA